ncbi:hypothetical protein [Streptomyces himalayensis]|uniref:hypothetical protein n=1 Tax=Streptomyces himalayensis TaxID=2820085 RepID=UPI0028680BAE|nr:hypothetical protein [Streptomyces himalayensis]
MRARRAGGIVNIASLGGLAAFGATGYYHATTFAVEGIFRIPRAEVTPLGHQGHRRRTRRLPHQLVRPLHAAVRDQHRRLRRNRRRTAGALGLKSEQLTHDRVGPGHKSPT